MNRVKNFLGSLGFGALFLLPSTMVLGPGCSLGKEVCDLQCDCTKCSDRAFDDCVDSYNRDADRAEAYDCRTEFDELHECFVDNFKCDEKDNVIEGPDADDCADEQKDLNECIADASKIIGGGSSNATTNATTNTTNATTDATSTTTGGGAACAEFYARCLACGGTAEQCDTTGATDAECQQAIAEILVPNGC